ncbi:MAG: glycerol-3-phosphate acyltransferase [Clostridia bacterium]|nr:glycerol-3-phosphate acyltransferase [Clostridia bacterium]
MLKIILKIVLIIAAYLVGAINMATIIGRLKGKNIKKLGSGNPGTMNVMRSIGKGWGALTFAFDCVKGVAFALIGRYALGSVEWMFILGACAVIGHIFPIYTKFKGGKGVATSLGMFMVATPIVGPCVFVALIIYLLVCKIGFIGS